MYEINDAAEWADKVHGWDVDDPVEGGVGGVDNIPLLELANRTVFLKDQIGDVGAVLDELNGEGIEDEEAGDE